jgi:DNA replication initiation complex subunit (GINS family)
MARSDAEKYIHGLESMADDIREKRMVKKPINPWHIETVLRNTAEFIRDNYEKISQGESS